MLLPDIPQMERELIYLLTKSLDKSSKWYDSDYRDIVAVVKKKTPSELRRSINNWKAIENVTDEELKRHCQFE